MELPTNNMRFRDRVQEILLNKKLGNKDIDGDEDNAKYRFKNPKHYRREAQEQFLRKTKNNNPDAQQDGDVE